MKRLIPTVIFILVSLFSCSKDYVGNGETGGGTETVIGKIVDTSGYAAEGVVVKLIPEDYNPIENSDSLTVYIDTTDSKGRYVFENVLTDTYNFFAYSSDFNNALIKQRLGIDSYSYYDFTDSLMSSGCIEINLPDTTKLSNRYVYIRGTDISMSLNKALLIDSSYLKLTMDNIPSGIYSEILLTHEVSDSSIKISREVDVKSNDTTLISAFLHWENINSINSKLPCDVVFAMAIDADGRHWYATDAGIATRLNDEWDFYNTFNSDLPSNYVYSIAIDPAGALWFGTFEGLAKLDNNKWSIFKDTDSPLPNNIVHKVVIGIGGEILVGTHNGAAIFDGESKWSVFTTSNSELPHNEIYCIAMEEDSTIWFGTDGGGIALYKNGEWDIFNSSTTPIYTNYIFDIKTDNKGRVLVGGNEYVAFYEKGSWEIVNIESPLGLPLTISEIAQESDSVYWFGSYTKGNVIRYEYGKELTYYSSSNSLLNKYVESITEIQINEIGEKWITTNAGGVYSISSVGN